MQFANSSDSGRCRGFVYLLKSGNAYCIEAASGFRTEMVLHEDTAFIESFPNPLVRPRLHWLHRTHLIMRVFYVVSDEYGSIQSFMEAFTKSGNHLRKLLNIEKFCMRPHANIVVFYGPNDGDTIIKKIGKEKCKLSATVKTPCKESLSKTWDCHQSYSEAKMVRSSIRSCPD